MGKTCQFNNGCPVLAQTDDRFGFVGPGTDGADGERLGLQSLEDDIEGSLATVSYGHLLSCSADGPYPVGDVGCDLSCSIGAL